MRVLVACEESQRVCVAFRERGHEAYSCDILPCSGGHPEWHIQGDALIVAYGKCGEAITDGGQHIRPYGWDLIIAHPPCTYLSVAGAVRLFPKKVLDEKRYELGIAAREFFLQLFNAPCPRICVENPIPLKIFGLPTYSQKIQPYEFGDPFRKTTCLWLKGLNPLKPTNVVEPIGNWVSAGPKGRPAHAVIAKFRNPKTRSKTFEGVARAMAEQWGTKID